MAEENTKLKMKNDIMFRAFFGRINNQKFLESFISSILGEPIKIKKVVQDARLEQIAKEDKYGRLDLDVERDNGEIINIEMQIEDKHNIEDRTSFYASKKMSEQLTSGDNYKELKRVIVIAILNYNFIPVKEYFHETVNVLKAHKDI